MKETVISEILSKTDIKEAFIVTLAEGKKGSAIFGNEICEELAHHIFLQQEILAVRLKGKYNLAK